MKFSRHNVIALLLLIVLGGALAACGSSETPAPAATVVAATNTQVPTKTPLPSTPTDTPEPTSTPSPTPDPLEALTFENLIDNPRYSSAHYETCKMDVLTMQCPIGWSQADPDKGQTLFASSEDLLDGFSAGASGGRLAISFSNAFALKAGSPEEILENFVAQVVPGGVEPEKILDGPFSFDINGNDVSAIIFKNQQKEPEQVMLLMAVQRKGRTITLNVSADVDSAPKTIPLVFQGLLEMETDVSAYNTKVIPDSGGSIFSVLGRANGKGTPSQIFSNSHQAVFIAVESLSGGDVRLDLIDMDTGKVLASSDRDGGEYLYYEIDKAGRYGYRVSSNESVFYQTVVVVTDGVTIAADAQENTFTCKLDLLTTVTYLAMVREGEKVFLQTQGGLDNQSLVAKIYALTDTSVPLVTISGEDTKGYSFAPPAPEWYLISVSDANSVPGPCMVTISYIK